jgi:membrane protein DedA with SNARE-associated domain
MQRMLPDKKRRELEDNFHKYGVAVLLFARFLPAIRSPIFVMAGVMRLPFTRFVMADGIYAIPGVSLLFTLSFWFGDQFRDLVVRIERKIAVAKPILFLLLISSVLAYLLYHFHSYCRI